MKTGLSVVDKALCCCIASLSFLSPMDAEETLCCLNGISVDD